nr:MAG TPA: hypothetical protein [Crassvirales sp.]
MDFKKKSEKKKLFYLWSCTCHLFYLSLHHQA